MPVAPVEVEVKGVRTAVAGVADGRRARSADWRAWIAAMALFECRWMDRRSVCGLSCAWDEKARGNGATMRDVASCRRKVADAQDAALERARAYFAQWSLLVLSQRPPLASYAIMVDLKRLITRTDFLVLPSTTLRQNIHTHMYIGLCSTRCFVAARILITSTWGILCHIKPLLE